MLQRRSLSEQIQDSKYWFITDNPERIGEKLVNLLLSVTKPDPRYCTRERWTASLWPSAREEKVSRSPTLRMQVKGIAIEEGIAFYEHLTGKLQVENLRPSFLIFSEGFKKPKLTMWMKRLIGFSFSSIGLILLSPMILIISIWLKSTPGARCS